MGKSLKKKLKQAKRQSRIRCNCIRLLIHTVSDQMDWVEELKVRCEALSAKADPCSPWIDWADERRKWEEQRCAVTPKG